MKSFEIAASMTDGEVLKCSRAVRFIRANDLDKAKSVVETMTESGMDKLLRFLEAKRVEWGYEDHR